MENNIPENLQAELLAQEEENTPMLGEMHMDEDGRISTKHADECNGCAICEE